MSDNPAGGPPREENDPNVPQDPYAAQPPSEPTQPVEPTTPAPGAYPPPASPYGPPAGQVPPGGAGYPPPPAMPPQAQPYDASAYGQSSGQTFAVGEALSYGWNKFTANWLSWVVIGLIFIAINILWSLVTGGFSQFQDAFQGNTAGGSMVGFSFGNALLQVVGTIISFFLTAILVRGALTETTGRKPAIGDFFQISNFLNVIVAALIVGILTFVGTLLCVLPGIAVAVFSMFVYFFLLDKQQDAISSIKSSWSVVAKNFGPVLLLALALLGINILGAIPCGLGLFVTIPLSHIALGFAYRRLVGEQPA